MASSTTDFYYFTAYISPDFVPPGSETNKKFRKFLTANEMRDLEMAYNTTKTNNVEVIYRHDGKKAKTSAELLGIPYALEHVPGVGLKAYIAMKNNKRDSLSRSMHAKITAGTLAEVSIQMDLHFASDNIKKNMISVDHIALLDIPSYFAYAQETTGGGSFIKETPTATFPPNKSYSLEITQQRLIEFLNSKKTVGHFSIFRSFVEQSRKCLLTIQRDFMSDSDTAAKQGGENESQKEDIVMDEAADVATKSDQTVADRITKLESDVKDVGDSIKQAEDKLKEVRLDKSADAKANEQELLAALTTLNSSKDKLEAQLDQLVKSGGLEAATLERLIKSSDEASTENGSIIEAVTAVLGEMMQDLDEDQKKKINHSVATNPDTKDAMVTVAASFVNRKRKSPGAKTNSQSDPDPDGIPIAKRMKTMEEKIDSMSKTMETISRSFTSAAKTNGISDIIRQAKMHEERARLSAAQTESISRQFSGKSTPAKEPEPKKTAKPVQKSRGRQISEEELSSKIASKANLSKVLAQATNSTMSH